MALALPGRFPLPSPGVAPSTRSEPPGSPHLLQRLPVGGELLGAAGRRCRHGGAFRGSRRFPGAALHLPPPPPPAGPGAGPRLLGASLRHPARPRRGGGGCRAGRCCRAGVPAAPARPGTGTRAWVPAAAPAPGGGARGCVGVHPGAAAEVWGL